MFSVLGFSGDTIRRRISGDAGGRPAAVHRRAAPPTTRRRSASPRFKYRATRSGRSTSAGLTLLFNQYYLGDRSNAGIDVVNTVSNAFTLRLTGFVGIVLNGTGGVNNAKSGPDGVTAHGGWVYGGDGDSTLKVFNIFAGPTATNGVPGITPAQSISTGGTTRVDEMALTPDGKLLLAANNAEDPPFATLFTANGDAGVSNVQKITKITVDSSNHPDRLRSVLGAAGLGTEDQAVLRLDPDHRQQPDGLQLRPVSPWLRSPATAAWR